MIWVIWSEKISLNGGRDRQPKMTVTYLKWKWKWKWKFGKSGKSLRTIF